MTAQSSIAAPPSDTRDRAADPLGMLLVGVPSQTMEHYVVRVLGPLIAYDRRRRTRLVQTLAAVYALDRSPTAAAESLRVHPNTVVKRLSRIVEVTGRDWRDPDAALQQQLALRLLRVIRAGR